MTSTMVQLAKEIHEMHKDTKEMHEKVVVGVRKRIRHSEVTSTLGQRLIHDLGLIPVHDSWEEPKDLTPIDPFDWDRKYEVQIKDAYKKYLQDHLADVLKEKKLCVYGVENGINVLSSAVPGHRVDLSGRTDLLILSNIVEKYKNELIELPGVRMAIEVKTDAAKCRESAYQATSELIALDLLVPTPAIVLLTDLNAFWKFYWLNERHLHNLVVSQPAAAFLLIRKTVLGVSNSVQLEDTIELDGFRVKQKKVKILSADNEASILRAPRLHRTLL